MARKDPKFAVNFLYTTLKKTRKEKFFPILKEKVANLLEENQYNEEAFSLRTANIDKNKQI